MKTIPKLVAAVLLALTALALLLASASSGAGSATAGLAFVKSDKTSSVWVANADGSGQRLLLAGGAQPILSPNGKLVAAFDTSPKHTGLVILRVGGGQISVPSSVFRQAFALAWSPDSRYLALQVLDTVANGQGGSTFDVLDTTTGKVTVSVHGITDGASFGPGTSDAVVFGLSHSRLLKAPANLYSIPADGSAPPAQLTHTGRAINPLWGPQGIIFDTVTLRKYAPAYQLALLSGGKTTQITHMRVPDLIDGLVPLALSTAGTKLVAEYEGEDTSEGYTVDLTTGKVTDLTVAKQENSAFGISRDGTRVLVSYGGFEGPSTHAKIATMPFTGGTPKVLLTGGYEPTWNQ